MTNGQHVIVRTYPGRTQAEASTAFAAEATSLSGSGYRAGMQAWAPPSMARTIITPIIVVVAGYLVAGWLGAAVGAVVGILYLLAFRPKGALTVTYTR